VRQPNLWISLLATFLFACFSAGCGGGGSSSMNPPPPSPTFTSVPPTAADEGADYTYQLAATSPDGSTVTFALSSAPTGASLSAGAISWTPAHDQSRIPNQFSVTATTAKGGSATQSWTVTPSGVVTVSDVITYWTPSGPQTHTVIFPSGGPLPAALIPQSDGAWVHLTGTTNPDGSLSIPHVPAGYFWLQMSPLLNYWTSSSSIDAGMDLAGSPLAAASQTSTTTIDINLTSTLPIQTGDLFDATSDADALILTQGLGLPGSTSYSFAYRASTNLDFSSIKTLFFNQYRQLSSGTFSGSALVASLTQSDVSLTNGAVNSVGGAMSISPITSTPIDIKGTSWAANFENVGPAVATPDSTSYSVSVQPFVENGSVPTLNAAPRANISLLEPNGTVLLSGPGSFSFGLGILVPDFCPFGIGTDSRAGGLLGLPPILTDQDFGSLSYGDPYPAIWQRQFEICQTASVPITRQDSTTVDQFIVTTGQLTALPSAPVAPLIGPVSAPTVNGAGLFQPVSLNTNALQLAWTPPAGVTPFGYVVTLFALSPTVSSGTIFAPSLRFTTAKPSVTLPPLPANTYVLYITAEINGGGNMESAPNRAKLPLAFASVVSAPITINPGANTTIAPAHD